MSSKKHDIRLIKASIADKAKAIELSYNLNKNEHIELNREEKITKAILKDECFYIFANQMAVGFVLFDYRFFDQGWIELIIVDKEYRGKGIAGSAFDLICGLCSTQKLFTSTNRSNTPMQRALSKANFSFAGELIGLDDEDPELFYYRMVE